MPGRSAIIHLSDIECGKKNRAVGEGADIGYETCADRLIEDIKAQVFGQRDIPPERVGLAITGDVTDTGTAEEFQKAHGLLIGRVADGIGIPRERIAVVPGNHDICWSDCKQEFAATHPGVDPDDAAMPSHMAAREKVRGCEAKTRNFDTFLRGLCGRAFPRPETPLVFDGFKKLGVALVGFDTTFPCTFCDQDNFGLLRYGQVASGERTLRTLLDGKSELVPMALMHHCPVVLKRPPGPEGKEDESYFHNGMEALDWLRKAGFGTVLCGHTHQLMLTHNLYKDEFVFVTGSFGLNAAALVDRYGSSPRAALNQYEIIFVNPEPGGESEVLPRVLGDPGDFTASWGDNANCTRTYGRPDIPVVLPRGDQVKVMTSRQAEGTASPMIPLGGTNRSVVSIWLTYVPCDITKVTYRLGSYSYTSTCREKNFPGELEFPSRSVRFRTITVEGESPSGTRPLCSIKIPQRPKPPHAGPRSPRLPAAESVSETPANASRPPSPVAPVPQESDLAVGPVDVFICHASEDKAAFVGPLAEALRAAGVRVFYDTFSIGWGDSIRRKIDEDLQKCRYGIVVLSKAFFAKKWPQYELDGLAERQVSQGRTVILPIWHEVEHNDVLKFSPSLAGCKAEMSTEPLPSLVIKIKKMLAQ